MRKTISRLTTFIFILSLAEYFGHRADPIIFVPPSQILIAFWGILTTGVLIKALVSSTVTLLIGFIVGAVPGIALGLLIGRYTMVDRIFSPYVSALYATPLVALVPLVIIWFGIGLTGKILYVALWVIFPILINTSMGVRQVDSQLLEVGKSFGATESKIFLHIIWPYTIPYIISSLRLAIGRGIVGLIVAEMSLRLTGLGGLLMVYSASLSTDVVLSLLLILMCFAAGFTELVKILDRVITPWRNNLED